ncbi:MAG: FmdB family zinc ribbon protein [Pyrinomonadaceae bacterium]
MPIYEYSCQKCQARVEVMQKIADKPLKRCQKCGGKLEKEWSSTSFQFKGSGWYVTDYAGKKKTDATAAEKESAQSESAGDTKSETATETKAEPAAGDAKESKKKKTTQPAATSKTSKSD